MNNLDPEHIKIFFPREYKDIDYVRITYSNGQYGVEGAYQDGRRISWGFALANSPAQNNATREQEELLFKLGLF